MVALSDGATFLFYFEKGTFCMSARRRPVALDTGLTKRGQEDMWGVSLRHTMHIYFHREEPERKDVRG